MADPIAWGLELMNGKKIDNVQDAVDALDVETPLENGLEELQSALNTAITQIEGQVDEMQEAIENAPVGIPPNDMQSITSNSEEDGIKLTFIGPKNSYINDKLDDSYNGEPYFPLLSTPAGIMIRYSDTSYPKTIKDGILAGIYSEGYNATSPTQQTMKVVGLTSNETYYFTAFPYSTDGVYNQSQSNRNHTICQWTGTKGTLAVEVSANAVVFPIGEITVTLTPTAGGEAVTQTRTGVGQVTFSNLEEGEYTLSVTDVYGYTHSSKTVTAIAGQLVTESIRYTLKTGLANYSWSEVISVADAGYAPQVFSAGETKDLTVLGETLTMKIYGFNHDDLTSGGKASITFGCANLMANMHQMNTSNTNVGSFVGSAMYAYLRDTVLPSLPEEIRTHIKTVNKKTSAGNLNSSVQTDAVQIFLFSLNEVYGSHSYNWCSNNEGSKYPVFSNDASRVKKLSNGAGAAQWWWLRSPRLNYSSYFCGVNSNGIADSTSAASGSCGVCFGFCL